MTIIQNIQNQVANFIEDNALPKIAYAILETEEDCSEYYISFHGRNNFPIDDLFDFKEHKIIKKGIDYDKFVSMCMVNLKEAFEKTFLQLFTEDDIRFIENAINHSKIDLFTIFSNFEKHPHRNIMKYVI